MFLKHSKLVHVNINNTDIMTKLYEWLIQVSQYLFISYSQNSVFKQPRD